MNRFLKQIILKTVPSSLLLAVKKRYYLVIVRSFWEKDLEPVRSFVKEGDTVIDVGANIGHYTSFLSSLVGSRGKVHGVEPIPDTFAILSFVVKRLGIANAELYNCALSDRDGRAVMEVPSYKSGGGPNFYQARIVQGESSRSSIEYEVETRSFDTLFSRLERVSFVKCDVEGHELSVFSGAREFLSRLKPALLVEVSGKDEKSPNAAKVFKFFSDLGYAPYWFDGERIRKRLPGERSTNYFFLQPHHASGL